MNLSLFIAGGALAASLLASKEIHAAECSHLWKHELQTGVNNQRGMSGDTNAAYALLSFRPESNLSLVLQGEYPRARFFSLESYKSRLLSKSSALMDYQISTTDGQPSPLITGAFVHAPWTRSFFEIEVATESNLSGRFVNQLALPASFLQPQSIMMRIYDPDRPLTPQDLPRVFAVDSETGAERACPRGVDIPFYLEVPQLIGRLAPFNKELKFGESGVVSGQNQAIPGYMYTLTQMKKEDGAFIRFKKPDARYFSVCVQNFLENQTNACLPDRLMKTDQNGFVYVAVSENHALLQQAAALGWNTLYFERASNQRLLGFVYRNILPMHDQVYEGDFKPVGTVCSLTELVEGRCAN